MKKRDDSKPLNTLSSYLPTFPQLTTPKSLIVSCIQTPKMPSPALAIKGTGQTSPIFVLPAEIFLDICDQLTFSEQNNLSRTCQYLNSTLQKFLFQRSASGGNVAMNYGSATGKIRVLRRSLEYGFPTSIDDIISYGNHSALALAGHHGRIYAVKFLLRQGADATKEGPDGRTPLAHVMYGLTQNLYNEKPPPWQEDVIDTFLDVILALLDAGADPKCRLVPKSQRPHPYLVSPVFFIIKAAEQKKLPLPGAKRVVDGLIRAGVDRSWAGRVPRAPWG